MHFTCKYASGTKFGTGEKTTNYVANVSSDEEEVTVRFTFRSPPQGKSNPAVTDAKIQSLSIALSTKEALQLAASIIAQAHHPTIHDSNTTWIPPQYMPPLTKNRWSRKLVIKANYWNNEISILNKTKFHLGRVVFSVTYRTRDENYDYQEHEAQIRKLVDLPPNQNASVTIEESDIPYQHREQFDRITAVCATEVTGIVPGQAK